MTEETNHTAPVQTTTAAPAVPKWGDRLWYAYFSTHVQTGK